MYCLSQKHGEFMSFDNWYASFWSYKNKTVNLRFVCVSMVISVVFALLLHTLITWLHHKQVFFFHNNDFAPIKCNWNAALCTWLLLSDCCDNLLIIVLPTGPQAFVLVSVCRHRSAQNANIVWATFWFPSFQDSWVRALCRLSDRAHLDITHSWTKQHGRAEEPSGSGTERLQCQRNGENDACVPTTSYCCVPHHTCRLIYSLSVCDRDDSSTPGLSPFLKFD